jgi:hypothetical protein
VSLDRIGQKQAKSLAALSVVVALATSAHAETGDVVVAEALFRDGKELLAQKDYARACPKLAESFRRDPASGTLLALAMCHEREGKVASAWGEYADVASRSKLEGRTDREKAARAKAVELEPRVSKLTISISPDYGDTAGLEVTRNGVAVASALLGTALPVDGGTQIIEAVAPGKKKWRAQVALASAGDRQMITVPKLDDEGDAPRAVARPAAPSPRPVAVPEPAPKPTKQESSTEAAPATQSSEAATDVADSIAPAPDADTRRGLTAWQRIGIGTAGAGIVGLGAGAFFTFRAVSKNNDSKSGCYGDMCLPAAKQDRLDARSAGNLATIGFVAGGALTAAGVVMYIVGRRPPAASTASEPRTIEAVPLAGGDTLGAALRGSF